MNRVGLTNLGTKRLNFRGRRIMDNGNFERDQRNFFKKVEGGIKHVG